MNEVNYGKCRNLSVIWEFRKITVERLAAPVNLIKVSVGLDGNEME
jgi:hypothetical protein